MFKTKRRYTDDEIIGVMANAIGYVIEGGNGRDDVQITQEKANLYRKAARMAINHMAEYTNIPDRIGESDETA